MKLTLADGSASQANIFSFSVKNFQSNVQRIKMTFLAQYYFTTKENSMIV
jgi:hypothetical protein